MHALHTHRSSFENKSGFKLDQKPRKLLQNFVAQQNLKQKSNGRCSAGNVNEKLWTLLHQLLPSLSMHPNAQELMMFLEGAQTKE